MTRYEAAASAKAEGLKVLRWVVRWPRVLAYTRSDDWQLLSVVCALGQLEVNGRPVRSWLNVHRPWWGRPLTDAERVQPEGVLEVKVDPCAENLFKFISRGRHGKLLIRPKFAEYEVHDAWFFHSFDDENVQIAQVEGLDVRF